jgi:glycosyltransferase involved in cell wall biosynthesis
MTNSICFKAYDIHQEFSNELKFSSPKFSVLLSLYNKESPCYLNECLESLHKQTLQAPEIVFVLDGWISAKHKLVINKWKKLLNLKIVPIVNNVGLSKALNHGLKYCTHELVFRMDTDDICYKNRFQVQYFFMINKPEVDICGSYSQDVSDSGNLLSLRKKPLKHDDILKLLWTNPFIHPSVVFRKSKIEKIGSYNVNAPHRHDDYELWGRAAKAGYCFANISIPLIKYRVPYDPYLKTTVKDRINTFKLGYKLIWKYDRRMVAYIGLLYPIIRSALPKRAKKLIGKIVNKFDPRDKWY